MKKNIETSANVKNVNATKNAANIAASAETKNAANIAASAETESASQAQVRTTSAKRYQIFALDNDCFNVSGLNPVSVHAAFANSALLIKRTSHTDKLGNTTYKFKGVAISGLAADTSAKDICKAIIAAQVAEFVADSPNATFRETTDKKLRSIFSGLFTHNTVIFAADESGKLSNAICSEVELSKTALRIKSSDKVVTCKHNKDRKSIINALAHIACADFKRFANINQAFARLMTDKED